MPPKKRPLPVAHGIGIKRFFSVDGENSRNDETVGDKSDNVEVQTPETETGEAAEDVSESSDKQTTTSGGKLKFQDAWVTRFGHWLKYDKEKNLMFCSLCKAEKRDNIMTVGSNNFKTTTITRHVSSIDHQSALTAPHDRKQFQNSVEGAKSKEEASILTCLKIVYWMSKEAIPLSKYNSLLSLLVDLKTPTLENLNVNKRVTYSSYKSACGFLDVISEVIDRSVTRQIQESPAVTILTDESTDITVHHKLCVSARVLDPSTMTPSTLFLTDIHITSATGAGIFEAIQNHLLQNRNIPVTNITGLGTDGASVMTGRKEGLTGQFLRRNPHLVNTHCAAHRVALCSEQAANKIPAMKYYQSVLESLFYYFKLSPKRTERLTCVQKLLDEPTLKCREVHQIRWMSFYQAMEAVQQTLDSLMTLFRTQSASDPKAKGLSKKLTDDFFVRMTYALIHILKPVMKMSLFFQTKDIDIGSIQTTVETCVGELQAMLDRDGYTDANLDSDLQGGIFKGNHIITKSSSYDFNKARVEFIQGLIDNVLNRFPDRELMISMCVFGLRPISFLSDDELRVWGDQQLGVILDHFGVAKTHTYLDCTGQKKTTTTPPFVDREETVQEWLSLKQIVKVQGYPLNSTATLWSLINRFHKEQFPNLLKLAGVVLTHPIHTADCERALSSQNRVVTGLRNRLTPENCAKLMRVMIQGPALQEFDLDAALNEWRNVKQRAMFKFS